MFISSVFNSLCCIDVGFDVDVDNGGGLLLISVLMMMPKTKLLIEFK